jgi:hypothetical protein
MLWIMRGPLFHLEFSSFYIFPWYLMHVFRIESHKMEFESNLGIIRSYQVETASQSNMQ